MAPLLLLFLGVLPSVASAEQGNPESGALPGIVGLRVGFDGHYKVGVWTPVAVVLRGGSREAAGRVSLTVPDGDGVPSRVSTPEDEPCCLRPGARSEVLLYARFGRVHSEATVRFETDDGAVVARAFRSSAEEGDGDYRPALSADRKLVVCLSASPVGVEEAAAQMHFEPLRRPVVARLDDLAQMPTRWYGYEGVDAVVIATSRPEVYRQRIAKGGRRQAALERWIRLGGRLLIMAGVEAERVCDAGSPLSPLVPGQWEKTERSDRLGGLESYISSATPIPLSNVAGRRHIMAARLGEIEGREEAWEANLNLPLVVRSVRGFGQSVFLAVDLDRPPLSRWKDRGALVARLLDWPKESEETSSETMVVMHLGYSDISGQLRSALDRFTGVWLVPFGVVVAVILLYLVLIGPGDYWLLSRLKRLGWTWATFPLLVVVFSAGAYWAAYRLKGTELRLNQVDLVDVDTRTGLVRGTHWSNLYSPRANTYNLSLCPHLPDGSAAADGQVVLGWLGLPGSGLGGMDPKTVNPIPWRRAYDFSAALDRMDGLPLSTWSTRSLTARWSTTWKDCPRPELVRRDDLLVGRLTNPLDFALDRCLLVYGRWVYELGRVGPGATIRVDRLPDPSELKTLLTGRHMVLVEHGDRMQFQAMPYDAARIDLPYILRMMMFFEHAGGRRYTHLSNQYQPFVDFSRLLWPDRAILIGVADNAQPPGAELCCDGRPLGGAGNRHMTFYRFVIPVSSVGSKQ